MAVPSDAAFVKGLYEALEARDVKYAIRFPPRTICSWLSVLVYDPGNLWRRLALPAPIGKWSFTSLQQRSVKNGGRLIQHARYYWLLLTEGHLTRQLFAGMPRKSGNEIEGGAAFGESGKGVRDIRRAPSSINLVSDEQHALVSIRFSIGQRKVRFPTRF